MIFLSKILSVFNENLLKIRVDAVGIMDFEIDSESACELERGM